MLILMLFVLYYRMDFQDIIGFIICSLVLSCGTVLLVVVPIAYFIGYLTLKFLPALEIFHENEMPHAADRPSSSNDVYAIAKYLQKTHDPLRNVEALSQELRNAGWNDKIINSAFEMLRKDIH